MNSGANLHGWTECEYPIQEFTSSTGELETAARLFYLKFIIMSVHAVFFMEMFASCLYYASV